MSETSCVAQESTCPICPVNIKMVSRNEATAATKVISKYTHRTPSIKIQQLGAELSMPLLPLPFSRQSLQLSRVYRQVRRSWERRSGRWFRNSTGIIGYRDTIRNVDSRANQLSRTRSAQRRLRWPPDWTAGRIIGRGSVKRGLVGRWVDR